MVINQIVQNTLIEQSIYITEEGNLLKFIWITLIEHTPVNSASQALSTTALYVEII